MSEERCYRPIKYKYNDSEMRELGESLAREAQTVFDLREQRKNVTAQLAAAIQAANKRVADLTVKVNQKYEFRDAECVVQMDKPRPGLKRFVLIDNQEEEITVEPMTMEEMQQSFGFPDPEKPE